MGTGQGISMGELTLQIARTMNAVDLITLSSSPSTVENPAFMLAQADRLYKEVGFCPRYTLQAGLEKTIAWWKQQNLVSCSTY